MDSLAEAYRGVGRGVGANVGDLMSRFAGDPQPIGMPQMVPPVTQGLAASGDLPGFLERHASTTPLPMRRDPATSMVPPLNMGLPALLARWLGR